MPDRLPVLVVDDDTQMRRTIGDILRFRGYDAIGASSGQEGLDAAKDPDRALAIALIDLQLPDMDGIELVSRLRDVAPLVEVLILTGHASLDSAVRALREQSYDYLVKPIHPDDLMASIARAGDRWQRRRAEHELEGSELRLRRMFDCVSDAVFITDDENCILDANPAAVTLSARSLEKLHGESLDRILEPFLSFVDVRSSVFAPGRCVHSVRDLSEQRRLQAALHRTQKMEIVGRLAGGVAHDFNNLLTVINNGTSMLMSSEAVPNADRGLLEAMKDAADRGAALTRQLTSLSRKQAAQPRVLNVNDMLTSLERILRLLIQTTSIDVRFALDPDIAPVLVDPVHLEEVIINLVINARDAMPAGGTLTIASRNARRPLGVPAGGSGTEPRDVAISVTDTGHGIPPETIPRIFEPFFTTKAEGNGTGLGLATVLSIVEEAGGVVDVTSEVGRGSVFTIYLPAA